MKLCVCLKPERGPLMGKRMALRQRRPTEEMWGNEPVSVCEGGGEEEEEGGGRQNLIRSKTNGGKDWVKEQEK